jgi:hypothetical protein
MAEGNEKDKKPRPGPQQDTSKNGKKGGYTIPVQMV